MAKGIDGAVNRFAQLIRIGNCIMGVVGLLLAVLIATGTSLFDFWYDVLVGAVVVFSFVAAGNSLNDYLDRDVDKVAHPERPIPSGRISPKLALWIAVVGFAIAIGCSLLLRNLESIIIVLAAILVIVLYELKTKAMGLIGNLSIAFLTGGLFLLGGAIVGHLDRTIAMAAMAFLATLGREIVKDIQDMEGDFDRITLPKRIGRKRAGIVGSVAFLLAVALSFLPYLNGMFGLEYLAAVLVADAIFIYSSIVHFQNPKKGQTWAKYGMLVALIAFLIGGLTL
jgi:geranylgeranylglycerol-phosphate geranylgeranyltransferase